MAPRYAWYTALLVVLWGILLHVLILLRAQPGQLYTWVHFGLGAGYDIMTGCACALVVYAVSLAIPRAGRVLGFAGVFALLLLNTIDYAYFREFQGHLPFSAFEYLSEARDFGASIASVVWSPAFVGLLLLPMAWATWLFWLRPGRPAPVRPGWRPHAARLAAYLLVGLLFNTASNSYVGKNLADPLQYTALKHLLLTRRQALAQPVQLTPDVLQRLHPSDPQYPLLHAVRFAGCQRPAPPFQELCQGLRALGERPNIVFVMLESFRAQELGAYGGQAGVSPHFDALARQGVLFQRFYGNGFQTRDGIAASYCSQLPNPAGQVLARFAKDRQECLPALLRRQGYHTVWMHNGDADFDGRRAFLPRNGFDRLIDRWDFPLSTPTAGWGLTDEALMRRAVQVMENTPEPFFLSIETITNHHPFAAPSAWRTHHGQGEYSHFLDTMAYTDFTIGRLIDWARQRPFAARTVFFLYADHSVLQPADGPLDQPREDLNWRHRIPLLVLAPWVRQGTRVPWPSSQVDLPPLVMDLLGFQGEVPWMGHSPVAGPEREPSVVVRPGDYVGLILPAGAAIRADRQWQVQGNVPEAVRQWASDTLLAGGWALQENRVMPPRSGAPDFTAGSAAIDPPPRPARPPLPLATRAGG